MNDPTNREACEAVRDYPDAHTWPCELLYQRSGAPWNQCGRAIERCKEIGLIDYDLSPRLAKLTEKGQTFLDTPT